MPRPMLNRIDDSASSLESPMGDIDPFPEENHYEGSPATAEVNRYERDSKARKRCIKHFGPNCCVCGLDFVSMYGAIVEGFIHVHHIVPISSIFLNIE